ncbi:MAG: hypothetical protein HC852_19745 [Acaryochloridaceae cyanobacterium RU_4_10]|nr:hypothetical protein [Acaryochloridaceae cyanobacterium RU_4_10]
MPHDRYAVPSPLYSKPQGTLRLSGSLSWELCDRDGTTIVSVSLPLPDIDPLEALDRLSSDRPHFYWEHPAEEVAIAALQPLVRLELNEGDRFAQAQRFIASVLQRTVTVGELDLPLAGPHFFCSFTFFEKPHHEAQRFPAATVFYRSGR